jgi:glycosyltransferase involved in cell wall biosynthesis
MKKRKLILLSDSCTAYSGVSRMSKNIILGLVKDFDIVQVAGLINNPDKGKILDISGDVKTITGIHNANVKLYPVDGYGNPNLLREILDLEKPDVLMHFTDPRQWEWLYNMANEIRQILPITYYHVWDNFPIPEYNKPFYESCDSIMCISKLTQSIVKSFNILNPKRVPYVPHGIDTQCFFPLTKEMIELSGEEYIKTKNKFLDGKEYDFILLNNNRNIIRKLIPDIIYSYKLFVDNLSKEQAEKTLLILKTDPFDPNGTNLLEVIKMVNKTSMNKLNIKVVNEGLKDEELNVLYNISDVVINIASQEGWGLSSTEAMMCGKMIINTITGGLQDQCNFTNKNKNIGPILDNSVYVTYTFLDENNNTITDNLSHGNWVLPIYPSTRSIIGSQKTPYIFEDKVNHTDLKLAIETIYDLSKEERNERGMKGREFAMNNYKLSNMTGLINDELNELLGEWKPIDKFKLYKF